MNAEHAMTITPPKTITAEALAAACRAASEAMRKSAESGALLQRARDALAAAEEQDQHAQIVAREALATRDELWAQFQEQAAADAPSIQPPTAAAEPAREQKKPRVCWARLDGTWHEFHGDASTCGAVTWPANTTLTTHAGPKDGEPACGACVEKFIGFVRGGRPPKPEAA